MHFLQAHFYLIYKQQQTSIVLLILEGHLTCSCLLQYYAFVILDYLFLISELVSLHAWRQGGRINAPFLLSTRAAPTCNLQRDIACSGAGCIQRSILCKCQYPAEKKIDFLYCTQACNFICETSCIYLCATQVKGKKLLKFSSFQALYSLS